jgi:gamma-glutamylcyclotransferase (GGCT)/AIG2-like uncharacterized protein YtfP
MPSNNYEEEIRLFLEEQENYDRKASSYNRSPTNDGHMMFVYGSLKFGYGNHDLIRHGNGVFIGEAVTVDSDLDMLSMSAFPAVYRGGNHQIAGEVYAVGNPCLVSLDRLEGNGHFYTREEVLVKVHNRFGLGMTDFTVPAWIYMVPAPSEVETGWRSVYRPNSSAESRVLNWKR